MAQKTPTHKPQPKQRPSLMQPEMDGVTSVRQFFKILFNRHRKEEK